MSAHLFAIENAAFAAWPALETCNADSWHLRFAQGYTKRANSANATVPINQLSVNTLEAIEAKYRAQNSLPVFRLVSFAAGHAVDNLLADRAYQFNDLTLVQTQSISSMHFSGGRVIELLPVREWFEAFQTISGKVDTGQAIHLKILQSIDGECAFAVKKQEGVAVCCGLAVVTAGCCGLFDIATLKRARGQGLATQLCADLLAWGQQQGADTAYLQVTAHNLAAIHVYEKLGFRRAYHYWYRVGVL